MCTNCGCSTTSKNIIIKEDKYAHNHDSKIINIHQSILAKNNHLASHNRDLLKAKKTYAFNVLSSPGSGKTAFIEKTLTDLKKIYKSAVIVGDLATDNDAKRLQKSDAQVVQIMTGDVCHLEAEMINKALQKINLDQCRLLIIENVGNLVCPAAYDLGEHKRIAMLSVTEGEDKPLKYPTVFKTADVVIINKMDIAEAVEFNQELALTNIKAIAPQCKILMVSARTGEGMENWYEYIVSQLHQQVLIDK